jgi:hypothetical protein
MRGGRSNNSNNSSSNRRGPNPLTRSYESNGPDVKVRGTPQHIAEKYMQLARDAHSSGDTVMAEAYLQHAEHYYRIIAAAQNAQQVAYNQANGIVGTADADAGEDEDEFEVAGSDRFTFRTPQSFLPQSGQAPGQQPFSEGGEQPAMAEGVQPENVQPAYQPQPRGDRSFGNRRPYEDRGDRQERPDQRPDQRPERQDRPDRNNNRRFGRDRSYGDRPAGERPFGERGDRPNYAPREGAAPAFEPAQDQPSFNPADQVQPGLPSFITAPVRPVQVEEAAISAVTSGEDSGIRPRRRRRTRSEMDAAAAGNED